MRGRFRQPAFEFACIIMMTILLAGLFAENLARGFSPKLYKKGFPRLYCFGVRF